MIIIKQLWKILTPAQKRKSIYMFFLTIVLMFLEILGISLIIPAITLLITDDITVKYPQLNPLIIYFGNPSYFMIVTSGMIFLIFVCD